jgi:hypothetical protein
LAIGCWLLAFLLILIDWLLAFGPCPLPQPSVFKKNEKLSGWQFFFHFLLPKSGKKLLSRRKVPEG